VPRLPQYSTAVLGLPNHEALAGSFHHSLGHLLQGVDFENSFDLGEHRIQQPEVAASDPDSRPLRTGRKRRRLSRDVARVRENRRSERTRQTAGFPAQPHVRPSLSA
jgi:hypothetical protein